MKQNDMVDAVVEYSLLGHKLTAKRLPITMLSVGCLHEYTKNPPCRTKEGTPGAVKLEAAIRARGIEIPLQVVKLPGGDYEIGDGNRRWTIAKRLGLAAVPCQVFIPLRGTNPKLLVEAIFNYADDGKVERSLRQLVAVLFSGGMVDSSPAERHFQWATLVWPYISEVERQKFLEGTGEVEALRHAWQAASAHFLSSIEQVAKKSPPLSKVAEIFTWVVSTQSRRGLMEHNLRWKHGNRSSLRGLMKAIRLGWTLDWYGNAKKLVKVRVALKSSQKTLPARRSVAR